MDNNYNDEINLITAVSVNVSLMAVSWYAPLAINVISSAFYVYDKKHAIAYNLLLRIYQDHRSFEWKLDNHV